MFHIFYFTWYAICSRYVPHLIGCLAKLSRSRRRRKVTLFQIGISVEFGDFESELIKPGITLVPYRPVTPPPSQQQRDIVRPPSLSYTYILAAFNALVASSPVIGAVRWCCQHTYLAHFDFIPQHARAFTRIGRHNPKTRICAKCFAFAFP